MIAVAPEDQPLCGQKRRGGAIAEEHSTIAKPAKRRRQSHQGTNTAYWDSLSKLWFTRRALNELNRRNGQKASSARTAATRRVVVGGEKDPLKNLSKQLKRFARHGGPDLRDLRGFPEAAIPNSTAHAMPSNQSSLKTKSKSRGTLGGSTAKTTSSKTKKSSPYDPNFEQNLIDNNIYPCHYDFPNDRFPPKPDNWKGINERLNEPRSSLSPTRFPDEAFDAFVRTNSRALNEDAVMSDVFPVIQGNALIPSAKNLAFGNLEPLTHGNFVDAKPDFYDGARPAQIDLRIREELGSYITPATQGQAPALPNFFTEAKGPDRSAAVAKRQACYNGAVGARGVQEFRSFRAKDPETLYDNNAYTITSTYHNGQLQIYTTHPTKPTDLESPPEYHMTQLNTFAITGTAERFREGVGAFRNARDWAKEQRDWLITAANDRVIGVPKETSTLGSSSHSMSQSTIEPVALESETSAEELSKDVGQGSSLSQKRLKRGSEKRSSQPSLKIRPKKSYLGTNSSSRRSGRRSRMR